MSEKTSASRSASRPSVSRAAAGRVAADQAAPAAPAPGLSKRAPLAGHKTYRVHDLSPYVSEDLLEAIPRDARFAAHTFPGATQGVYKELSYTGFRDYEYSLRKASLYGDLLPRRILSVPHHLLTTFAARSEAACQALAQAIPSRILTQLAQPEFANLKTCEFERLEEYRRFFDPPVHRTFFKEIDEPTPIPLPALAHKMQWRSDRFFAQQMLGGANPRVFKRVNNWKKANESMLMSREHVSSLLRDLTGGISLQALAAQGRLFMADFYLTSHINGVIIHPAASPPPEYIGKRAPVHSPAVLFWADDDRQLMPLAIQINSGRSMTKSQVAGLADPDERAYYQTPPDQPALPHVWYEPDVILAPLAHTQDDAVPTDWLYARLCVMNADSLMHIAESYLGMTYLVPAAVATSMYHTLPPGHPIRDLLQTHTSGTIEMSVAASVTFLQDSQANFFCLNSSVSSHGIRRLAAHAMGSEFHFHDRLHFPTAMAKRGFGRPTTRESTPQEPAMEPAVVPRAAAAAPKVGPKVAVAAAPTAVPLVTDQIAHYFYRDYGLLLWDALEEYITTCVDTIYPTDESMIADDELAFFYAMLTQDEIDGSLGAKLNGIPDRFYEDRKNLVAFLTSLLFTVTVHRSATAMGQFDFYGFAPSRPLFLAAPFQRNRRDMDEAFVIKALPNALQVLCAIITTRALSRQAKQVLVKHPSTWQKFKDIFRSEGPFENARKHLEAQFASIEAQMKERNRAFTSSDEHRTFPAYTWMLPSSLAASVAF